MQRSSRQNRRGVSTLWVILGAPAFITLLLVVTDSANIWLARAELENGLEAAALAAVKSWSGGGATLGPRTVGVEYAATNTVLGTPLTITNNYNPANPPNENTDCAGNLIFGAVTTLAPPYTFNSGVAPGCPVSYPAVRAQATVQINSLWQNLFGIPVGPYNVSAQTTAIFDCTSLTQKLVRIDTFICP